MHTQRIVQVLKLFFYPSSWALLIGGAVLGLVVAFGLIRLRLVLPFFLPQGSLDVQVIDHLTIEDEQQQLSSTTVFQYEVAPGDSLWTIAEQFLGDGVRYHELVTENQLKNPSFIQVGQLITIPELEAESEQANATLEMEEVFYTVIAGDSLSRIAKQELGNETAWVALYELNRQVVGPNPHLIYPGTKLVLPNHIQDGAADQSQSWYNDDGYDWENPSLKT